MTAKLTRTLSKSGVGGPYGQTNVFYSRPHESNPKVLLAHRGPREYLEKVKNNQGVNFKIKIFPAIWSNPNLNRVNKVETKTLTELV